MTSMEGRLLHVSTHIMNPMRRHILCGFSELRAKLRTRMDTFDRSMIGTID
jgi:hypothetical protein